MKRTAALTAAAALMLTACGSHPDPAACKTAMKAEFAAALQNGTQGTEPAACKGIPASQLRRFAAEIISGH